MNNSLSSYTEAANLLFYCIKCSFLLSAIPGTNSITSQPTKILISLVEWDVSGVRGRKLGGKSGRSWKVNKTWKTVGKKAPMECFSILFLVLEAIQGRLQNQVCAIEATYAIKMSNGAYTLAI